MRLTILALVLGATLGGCGGGDDSPPAVDAPGNPVDGAGGACTGEPYDRCADVTNWTDCMDGMECRFFMGQGFTICTPVCDVSTPCPNDEQGNPVSCNVMGRCRSDAPNSCTL